MQNSTVSELSLDQMDLVGGGGYNTGWSTSIGVASGFAAGAIAVIAASPAVALGLALASIYASGAAIYYAVSDDESKSKT